MKEWEFPNDLHLGATRPQEGIPMSWIVPPVPYAVKQKLIRQMRRCCEARTRLRYLIILNLLSGRGAYETAVALRVHNTTVYQVAKRFRQRGVWGLLDGREDNGTTKLDEYYLTRLYQVVRDRPPRFGWRRPTWTRELLVETMARLTGIRIHVATMSRALALVGARRGRPRPIVRCPWSAASKTRRLNAIRRLLAELPPGHVAVYADEVDIHLNPKIGWDWMVPGQQKEVLTPGQNVKRYLAGAIDSHTRQMLWVEGETKTSALFIALLERVAAGYPEARVIHVVVDNFRIHDSKLTRAALAAWDARIHLHFLPPYCPHENKIERVWEDLHSNVTRNHMCPNMIVLMHEVRDYLWQRNQQIIGRMRDYAA
jgi:transposase